MTWDEIRGDYHSAEQGLTNRFAGQKITEAKIVEAEGVTELVKPSPGKQLTLYWIALNTPETNTGEVLVAIGLEPYEPYVWYLGVPGAFMHWEPVVGEADAPLVLSLSAAEKVAVNFTYTESYPGNE